MNYSLSSLQLARTEKIIWRFPAQSDVLAQIKSKSLRSFLSHTDEILEQNHITTETKELDEVAYLEWLPYYREKMTENEYDVLANEEWFSQRQSENKNVEGIFFYQNGKVIGSGIMTLEGTHKAALSFKATDRIELSGKSNASLGAVVDFMFLKTATNRGFEIISGGRSRNAFGVINTLGYLDYKLKLGYRPSLDASLALVEEVPLNEAGVVVFLGCKNQNLHEQSFFGLIPKGHNSHFEFTHYLDATLPFTLIEY